MVEEIPYDAVDQLRIAWHGEDFPGVDASEFFAHAREVSIAAGTASPGGIRRRSSDRLHPDRVALTDAAEIV